MNDFLRIITHARRLKSALKELGVEQLEEIKMKLQKIIDDRIAEEEAAQLENAERLEKIRKYREALAADGIDPDELQEGSPAERPNKKNTQGESVYLQKKNKSTPFLRASDNSLSFRTPSFFASSITNSKT